MPGPNPVSTPEVAQRPSWRVDCETSSKVAPVPSITRTPVVSVRALGAQQA